MRARRRWSIAGIWRQSHQLACSTGCARWLQASGFRLQVLGNVLRAGLPGCLRRHYLLADGERTSEATADPEVGASARLAEACSLVACAEASKASKAKRYRPRRLSIS